MTRKVISIALFGDADRKDGSGMNYGSYLQTFVLAHANLFPSKEGWELRVHCDTAVFGSRVGKLLDQLHKCNLIVCDVRNDRAILTKAMLWRADPVFTDADFVFCRDVDCIPMPRDREVCDVFIASGCAVSTCHDSSSHVGVMGGLCGFNSAAFRQATGLRSLTDLYAFANKSDAEWARHGTDQIVLNTLIDQITGLTLLEHRYNGWHAGPNKYSPRPRGEYRCKAMSTPTPDVGKWRSQAKELVNKADLLANHLGAAGFDYVSARAWWERYGDPEITKLVRECET